MLLRLFPFFQKNKTELSKTISLKESRDHNIHTLSVILYPNDIVDILLTHPDLEQFSISEISKEAEKFAELLVHITNAPMEPKLLAVITNKSKITESIKEQLFYDNIITYYNLIKSEFEKNTSDNDPVIRPSAAFNQK